MMNRGLNSAVIRGSLRRAFSNKNKAQPVTRNGILGTLSQPSTISGYAGIPQAWRPFDPIADEILGSRFTDEWNEAAVNRFSRVVDEAPLDCKESLKDFQLQINLPGTTYYL